MSKQSDKSNSLDLSGLDFGPAWVREESVQKKVFHDRGERSQREKRGGRKGEFNVPNKQRAQRRNSHRREPHTERPRRRHEPLPEGVKASIMPIEEGVDNLVKEISSGGRTYSIFDLARLILKSRERYNVCFTVQDEVELNLYQSSSDKATFLTELEALNHFESSEKFSDFYREVQVEVEAPKGNFPTIAVCGYKGDFIAPPNYHGYQKIVARRHASHFSNMSLEKYKSRIVVERNEEHVAAWLESMKKQSEYQLVSDEEVRFKTKSEAVKHFKHHGFLAEYPPLKRAFVNSDISFNLLSSGLASGLIEVISDQNRYPGELSSFLCRQLSGRHLAVYKWQNKLHAGPSRPHAIPESSSLADRPKAILQWVEKNSSRGIDELWKGVWPDELEEEEKTAWFHDLHWMLNQGYLVLLENGCIHLSSESKHKPLKKKRGGKKNEKADPTLTPQKKAKLEVKSGNQAQVSAEKEVDEEAGEKVNEVAEEADSEQVLNSISKAENGS